MDSHPSVRGYAQFQLVKGSAFDLREFYCVALRHPTTSDLRPAILGVGETGNSSDVSLIIPYLTHEAPRTRKSALRTLARLNPQAFVSVFRQSLSDSSPGVSREAMKGLCKNLHLLAGEDLWTVFATNTEIHVFRNVLFLIARLGKWESIGYLVNAVGTENEKVRQLAEIYIRRWSAHFNSSFATPTTTQRERINSALHRTGTILDSGVLRQIEYGLRSL